MATVRHENPMRDLGAARAAFTSGDVEASKQAHLVKKADEGHKPEGGYIKNVVFGGLDGIITTFAVVSGATGGGLGTDVILILGFSNIFADALSMGVGDALSTKAEHEYIRHERGREKWEFENFPGGEIEEMIDLYTERGMSREDATDVIRKMAKYKEFFIDIMMVEELSLQIPDDDESPWFEGFITFVSFVVFGMVPLFAYAFLPKDALDEAQLFGVACGLTAVCLFALGALKTRFSVMAWWKGGMEILTMGSACAGAAYLIGWFVNAVVLGGNATATAGHR